jgi:hypothetical protein
MLIFKIITRNSIKLKILRRQNIILGKFYTKYQISSKSEEVLLQIYRGEKHVFWCKTAQGNRLMAIHCMFALPHTTQRVFYGGIAVSIDTKLEGVCA